MRETVLRARRAFCRELRLSRLQCNLRPGIIVEQLQVLPVGQQA